jgi:hypothetical protein
MLRSIGIPARVVEGFVGMEPTQVPNEFIVRFSRAHAWVEAILDGSNWTTLDPTPAASEMSESYLWRLAADLYDSLDYKWTKDVIYFDRSDQAMIFEAFTKLVSGQVSLPFKVPPTLKAYVVPIIAAACGLLVVALIILRSSPREGGSSAVYLTTMSDLVEKGILLHVHAWHEENVAEIIAKFPSLKDPVQKFVHSYLDVRFGGAEEGSAERLKEIRKELLESVTKLKRTG